jgi:cephalosporin hydroxylase
MSTEVWDAYHRWYYDAGVWCSTTFLGIPSLKSVSDMWNYQEIIVERKPSLVIEFGTSYGGSALVFSTILQAVSPGARLLTVDAAPQMVAPAVSANPHIECLASETTHPRVAERIAELRRERPGRVFAILDSDHQAHHVLGEMRLLRPLLTAGDYLVVEDSNINGHPVLPGWGPGPMEAVDAYEREHPGDYDHDVQRERKFGLTFAPRGFLVRR